MSVHRVMMDVQLPMVPNFLRLTDGQTVPLCAAGDDDLRGIAKEWGEALVKRAAEQRKQQIDGDGK